MPARNPSDAAIPSDRSRRTVHTKHAHPERSRTDPSPRRATGPAPEATRQNRKDTRKDMLFEYTRRRGARSPVTDAPTFRVRSLSEAAQPKADLSHLIDRSYNYHSPRELRWHLAERLGLALGSFSLREAA